MSRISMRAELVKAPPLDFDPYEEDCCGAHSADRLDVYLDQDSIILSIQEKRSGIGDEYTLTARTKDGRQSPLKVTLYIDDDGEFHFYGKERR